MSIFRRKPSSELSDQAAAHQRIEQALRDFNLQMAEREQAAERRLEKLLSRLDTLDEAMLAAQQANLLMVEMLEKKKPVRKKTGAREG